MGALVGFPVRARAAAPALPIIGYAATIAAFLAACGIYPFQDEHGQSFGEWGARKLTELWDTYINEVYPTSEAAQVISDVKSFYSNGGYMVMARDTWSRLRGFAGWITDKFGLASNQTDVALGVYESYPSIPCVLASEFSAMSNSDRRAYIRDNGLFLGWFKSDYSYRVWALAYGTDEPVYAAICRVGTFGDGTPNYRPFFFSLSSARVLSAYDPNPNAGLYRDEGLANYGLTWGGITVYRWELSASPVISTIPGWVGFYESQREAVNDIYGTPPTLAGTMADTGLISVPAELPESAEFGGLAVVGAGATAETLEDVIEQGVMERQRPVVRPVDVEIGVGIEVDAGTGTVAAELPDTIIITPDSVPLSLSDYSIPGLSELFPFSVPWDIMRIWQALDAEPRWFLEDYVLTWDIPELWGDAPLVVTFRMEDMPQQVQDAVQGLARTVRAFLLILACIGFLIFAVSFIKF